MESQSTHPRLPFIPKPGDQRASHPKNQLVASSVQQAPAQPAMAPTPAAKIHFLAKSLTGTKSFQETSESFTRGLAMVADNTADMSFILSGIIKCSEAGSKIYEQAKREEARVRSGCWNNYFMQVAAEAQWLTNTWGGLSWLPADVRAALQQSYGTPVPSSYVPRLVTITRAAQVKGIDLHSLWADGGLLRKALGNGGQQCLYFSLAQIIVDEIKNGGTPVANKAPHQSRQSSTVVYLNSVRQRSNDNKTDRSGSIVTTPIHGDLNHETPIAHGNDGLPVPSETGTSKSLKAHTPQSTSGVKGPAPPVIRKRTFEQMIGAENSTYNKYKILIMSIKPGKITQLRSEAIQKLEQAESEKAAADYALGGLEAREEQLRQIRSHSRELVDSTNSGLRESANHDVLAGIVANTGEIYLNGVNKLLDSFLQASSDSQNGLKAEQLRVRQAEAIKKVGEAKKRIQALDDIDRARAIHENYIEMNEFRQSMRAVWMKTGECARDLEKACIAAFSHAEEQD
ncbi:hypothetical protein NW765_015182 [Fusarium oxysporum]|nr:hypothetical protein FOWG_15456 [Fusarium oxysporum f. sp. lycopersici MN25]KAJ4154425.1 hypothetical protein NW765_015182 [Fusarium oxysporum]KAJ4275688.1 hypothetical protein NW764_010181 [Fusarium oxysporum]